MTARRKRSKKTASKKAKRKPAKRRKKAPPKDPTPAPLRPNMLLVHAEATSSTFSRVRFDHSVIADSMYLNCRFNQSNFEGSSISGCDLDGAVIENCSLKGVEIRDCDLTGLVIDGVRVGDLLAAFTRS